MIFNLKFCIGGYKVKKKIILISIVISIALILYGVYWAFFDMGRLPKDRFINEVESPDGKYSIKAYVSESSLSSPAVLGELNYKVENRSSKNIYWNYKEDHADIQWTSNTTVIINGHKLNVLHDTYDWRRNK